MRHGDLIIIVTVKYLGISYFYAVLSKVSDDINTVIEFFGENVIFFFNFTIQLRMRFG
jgi:hypothetical protein